MTDFETHPAGTADLVKRLREKQICTGFEQVEPEVIDCVYGSDPVCQDAADRIEQLEAALTRANAATAAACEVMAKKADNWHVAYISGKGRNPEKYDSTFSYLSRTIRALATPDQTAALDKLIAEAEVRVLERAAIIANKLLVRTKFGNDTLTEVVYSDFVGAAILAASKKGGV